MMMRGEETGAGVGRRDWDWDQGSQGDCKVVGRRRRRGRRGRRGSLGDWGNRNGG
jgi:hypothetical protein